MGDPDVHGDLPIPDLNESKELKVTINGPADDLNNGLDDEELLSWKAGRREWLIIIDLVAVALVVVSGPDTPMARFPNPLTALDATILVPALPVSYILCASSSYDTD